MRLHLGKAGLRLSRQRRREHQRRGKEKGAEAHHLKYPSRNGDRATYRAPRLNVQ
jgi:hypothetical protein